MSAIFLFLLLAVPVWGQERIKIGFIDFNRAMNESQPGMKARERLKAEFKKVEADILKEEQELRRLRRDIEKKGLLLKEQTRRELEREYQKRVRDYERDKRDREEDLRQRQNDLMAEIVKELQKIVTEIGEKENFTLILERGQVLYTDQGVEITDKVIELYDSRFGKKVSESK
ncbi:MAG: OmpH family outer membrane protein [Deltaproteobacteria bacterium]|nr:OmpH family outer membrane protein [Deltaproteobacteria bacterium]